MCAGQRTPRTGVALLVCVLAATLFAPAPAVAAPCGETLLSLNFDQYSGGFRPWTMAEVQSDLSGVYADAEAMNAQVGEGEMKVDFPPGVRITGLCERSSTCCAACEHLPARCTCI